jgi:dTDP-4-amino-4,6-dideoxygalactose transaminase
VKTPFPELIPVTRPILPPLPEVMARLERVWDSGWLTNHAGQHRELAARLRDVLKVPHVTLFANGTLALMAALRALRLEGEVITTPLTFPATPHAVTWAGLTPVFADVDARTLGLDPACVDALVTDKTSAVLAVHLYGTACDVDGLEAVARRHGLKLIYDAAHAFGVEIGGRGIGTFGDVTMMSFHATKTFTTAEGGCLCYADPELGPRLHRFQNFGIEDEDTVLEAGLNAKMNELQAALGLVVLEHLAAERRKRREIADAYDAVLAGVPGVARVLDHSHATAALQYYVVRIDAPTFGVSRDEVHASLRRLNVGTRRYFSPLCSTFPVYRDLASAQPGRLPVATRAAAEVLCLPFWGDLGTERARIIAGMLGDLGGVRRA